MELLKAIERLNRLKNDAKSLEEWLWEVEHGHGKTQPVKCANWRKLKNAIDGVQDDINLDVRTLETKIQEASKGVEIDI